MKITSGLLLLALATTGGFAQATQSGFDGLFAQQPPPVGGPQAGPRGQQGQFGGGMQRGGMMGHQMAVGSMLRDPKVQKELNLTQEQIEKINQAFPQMMRGGLPGPGGPGGPPNGGGQGGFGGGQRQGGGQGGFGGGQGQGGAQGGFGGGQRQGGQGQGGQFGGPPQGGPGGPGFGQPDPAQMEKERLEIDNKVKSILNAKQFNRYKELEYQFVGAPALGWKEVADKVQLSEEQRLQVQQAIGAFGPFGPRGPQGPPPNGGQGGFGGGQGQGQGGQGGFGGGQGQGQGGFGGGQRGGGQGQGQGGFGGPPQGGPPQGQPDMFKERDSKILAILNDAQRAAWQKLQGPKFEFSPRQLRGPGGPGGSGGPGGPPNGGGGGIGGGNA